MLKTFYTNGSLAAILSKRHCMYLVMKRMHKLLNECLKTNEKIINSTKQNKTKPKPENTFQKLAKHLKNPSFVTKLTVCSNAIFR